jgi:hypothetical protein
MRHLTSKLVLAACLPLALIAAAADAAEGPGLGAGSAAGPVVTVAPEPESYGTADETVISVGPHSNLPPTDTVTWATSVSGTTGIGLFQASGVQVDWWYQLANIPSGAILTRVQLEACDTSATGQIAFGLASGVAPGGAAANISAIAGTGIAPTPGCAFFTATPTVTTTVNNGTNDYWLFYAWTTPGAALQVHSIRVFYRLQVSPAPAVASFTDVPVGHPQMRFVEALVDAGITGGCGGGNYCPDSPVTRGQMAVFLSVALGLHFTP